MSFVGRRLRVFLSAGVAIAVAFDPPVPALQGQPAGGAAPPGDARAVEAVEAAAADTRDPAPQGPILAAEERQFRAAAEAAEEAEDFGGAAEALRRLGSVFEKRGQFDRAAEVFNRALDAAASAELHLRVAELHNDLGRVQATTGNLAGALASFEQAAEAFKLGGDGARRAEVLNNLGVIHNTLGNPARALDYLLDSLRLKESLGGRGIGAAYNNIAAIYSSLGEVDNARGYYRRFLELSERAGDLPNLANAHVNLAMLEAGGANFEVALHHAAAAVAAAEELGYPQLLANFYTAAGRIYGEAGWPDEGLEHLRRGLALQEQMDDPNGMATTHDLIARALLQAGLRDEAVASFRRAYESAQVAGSPSKAAGPAASLSALLAEGGEFEEAYRFAVESKEIGDQLLNQEQIRAINRLEMVHARKLEAERRELEHERFQEQQRVQREVHEAEEEAQRLMRTAALGGAAAAFVLVLGLYRAARETRVALEKVRASEAEVRRANASKDRFFSIVAHDLRSPFEAIIGLSQIVIDDFEQLPDEEKVTFLKEVNRTGRQTHLLLENLLRWAHLQTGNTTLTPALVDVGGTVESELDLLRAGAGRKGVTLGAEIPRGTTVFANPDAISTVVRNLVSNAIKFTGEEGSVTVVAREVEGGSAVEIQVVDTGVGIPPERVGGIFDLDKASSTRGTAGEKGTGLGLTLCHEFVDRSGGRIWVESEVGAGTRFIFVLPAATNEQRESLPPPVNAGAKAGGC